MAGMKPSTIRALAEKGFTAEQIALIAEVEQQETEGRRAKDRERQARKREKDRVDVQLVTRSHAESRGQAVTSRDIADEPSPSSSPPITPLITTPSPSSLRSASSARAPAIAGC